MHDQLIHETNLSDNGNDPGPAATGRVGPAEPGPTISSCTLFRCVCHIHYTTHGHVLAFNYTNFSFEINLANVAWP